MRFEESPATEEEDSYGYRIEWNNYYPKMDGNGLGPGSMPGGGFDNAWEQFTKMREGIKYSGVKLIKIDKDGNETVYAS
ncbi:hypothetical protein SAMN04487928_10779 [Butyrivibrio proteoclasticus]|uniref:Uncharacterized protein n=1 Tax=Butyrivibrio proteoclasticus TaxID=43305 RepID=A0A1I5SV38_9FIRM|nr:hypothetical protein [Butyrivibrio proteoclasticus]SFP74632.1 hypothetical protein SAMN04487928_10779 [Butyrivibrio proteoclasticus]